MKLKYIFLPLLGCFLLGCSTDDSSSLTPSEPNLPAADFIAIGQDFDNVYQYTFDGTIKEGEQVNLTQELNITRDYLTIREVGDLISFYYFNQGSFSLVLRDVRTGLFSNYLGFYANNADQSVAWGINNESNVFFGFFGPQGTRNIGIQDVELQTKTAQDTSIDIDIDLIFEPVIFDERVYFAYRTNMGNYKFTFYDTLTKSAGPILDFGNTSISFLVTESGDLAIIKNEADATLELYTSNLSALIETNPLRVNTGFATGSVDGAVFDDGVLYYAFPFVQPSEYISGPAFFDTVTEENNVVDLFGITDGVEVELGETIGLTVQIFDPIQKVFLVGYEILDGSARGGVLEIGVDGKLISYVPLSFVPTYFIRN